MEDRSDIWRQALEVEGRIKQEFAKWNLTNWYFFWDKTKRRLGACWFTKRAISLSRHLLGGDQARADELWITFLHELAHALAFIHNEERGHGSAWREWCFRLGIPPERLASSSPLDESTFRYAIRRKDTGEIVARYFRKPHFKNPLNVLMLKNAPETKGQLEIIPYPPKEESSSE